MKRKPDICFDKGKEVIIIRLYVWNILKFILNFSRVRFKYRWSETIHVRNSKVDVDFQNKVHI